MYILMLSNKTKILQETLKAESGFNVVQNSPCGQHVQNALSRDISNTVPSGDHLWRGQILNINYI